MRSVLLKFPSKDAFVRFCTTTHQKEIQTGFEYSKSTFIGHLYEHDILMAIEKFGAVEVDTNFEQIIP